MNFKFLFKTFLIFSTIGFIVSCDKDVNEIGADILQNNNHFGLSTVDVPVLAYNQKTGAVQSNNLPINSLGFYDNDVFGKTTANFVTQLSIGTRPVFYKAQADIVVDSVYMYVPYFTKNAVNDATTGDTTYDLDSIQGQSRNIKLEVFKSNYFLNDNDPASVFEPFKHFTDENNNFAANIDPYGRLNNDNKEITGVTVDNSQNDKFFFNQSQIKLYKDTSTRLLLKERLSPGMFLNLDTNFFKTNIIQAPLSNLDNDNAFHSYFRGLYFKATALSGVDSKGAMARMNFSQGKVTIVYKDYTSATDLTLIRKTLVLKMSGNSVNLIDNVENPSYTAATSSPDFTNGDSKLYLKGGNGSQSIIKLFGGLTTSDPASKLAEMRRDGWLINDAYLTFFIDNTTMGTEQEPNRLYLYDYDNKRPIIDYFFDPSSSANSKYNKYVYGGIIEKNASARGTQYKIRITNHLRNLIKYGGPNNPATNFKDSTNVKLGLVVTENINNNQNAAFKTPPDLLHKFLPVMSVVNPLGTVLWGSNQSVPVAKRVKLQIYYTKPN